MDEAARVALDKAFELAPKNGQPWGAGAILKAAREFEQFLTEPGTTEPLTSRVEALELAVTALAHEISSLESSSGQLTSDGPAPSRTRQRSKPAATKTTQPDGDIDIVSDPDPIPVDF